MISVAKQLLPQSFSSILGSNVPGVLLGERRLLLITQQRHRSLYGSHLQSIMSPRFYAQYASDFNTLASIFVCSPAFLFVFPPTLAFSAFHFKEIIFHSASSCSADKPRQNFHDLFLIVSCEEEASCHQSRKKFHNVFFKSSNFFTIQRHTIIFCTNKYKMFMFV